MNVTIIISGPTGSGKPVIRRFIEKALTNIGCRIETIDNFDNVESQAIRICDIDTDMFFKELNK